VSLFEEQSLLAGTSGEGFPLKHSPCSVAAIDGALQELQGFGPQLVRVRKIPDRFEDATLGAHTDPAPHFYSAPAVFEVLLSQLEATSVLVEPLHQSDSAHFLCYKFKGVRTCFLESCPGEPPVQPVGQIFAEGRFAERP
jgi:hypothetical protein